MKAEIPGADSIRILLTADELAENGLTFQTLNDRSARSRAFLLSLTRAAGLLLGKDLAVQNLHLEVYPYADGSCLFCLSRIQNEEPPPVAAFADTLGTLLKLCRTLLPFQTAFQSSAYRFSKRYILLLRFDTAPAQSLLERLNTVHTESGLSEAFLREHAEILLEQDAVSRLAAIGQAR